MLAAIGWLDSIYATGGLDHLGSQAPCVSMYQQLLPGITNVTDRLRYYTFYPWLFSALSSEHGRMELPEIKRRLRRAEVLLSFVAQAHARDSEGQLWTADHDIGVVGNLTVSRHLEKLFQGQTLKLSDYAAIEGAVERYFQNPWGGLAQYYLGPLRDLGILAGTGREGIQFTRPRGQVLGSTLAEKAPGDVFIRTIEENEFDLPRLRELAAFCPCSVGQDSRERTMLAEMLFGANGWEDRTDSLRRDTLRLILHTVVSPAGASDALDLRARWYGGIGDGLVLPESLSATAERWQTYATNDLLSYLVQDVFWSVLETVEGKHADGRTLQSFAEVSTAVLEILPADLAGESVARRRDELAVVLPARADTSADDHEWQQLEWLRTHRPENPSRRLERSVDGLLRLLVRTDSTDAAYADFDFPPTYFDAYPVNLDAFVRRFASTTETIGEMVTWIVEEWCLRGHTEIAMRKLRSQSSDTFLFRPAERGLVVTKRSPWAALTTPRVAQALQLMVDLGALRRGEAGLEVTDDGRRWGGLS